MSCDVSKEKSVWYHYYSLTYMFEDDEEERSDCGLVPGVDFVEAMSNLQEYFGDDIVKITTLVPVSEGKVLSFEEIAEDGNVDFVIERRK